MSLGEIYIIYNKLIRKHKTFYLLIQSDVEGDSVASIGKVRLPHTQCRHLSKLGSPGPDVVLVAGRDLASEVELGDEGLALLAGSNHLNISESNNCQ